MPVVADSGVELVLLLIQPGVTAAVVTQLSSPCCPGGGGAGLRRGWSRV